MKLTIKNPKTKNQSEITRFTSYDIKDDLDIPCNDFSLTIANPEGVNTGKINQFDEVTVTSDTGDDILYGIADRPIPTWNDQGTTMGIPGRDWVAELRDNDAWVKTYNSMTPAAFIQHMLSNRRVNLKAKISGTAIDKIAVNPGETEWDVIERVALKHADSKLFFDMSQNALVMGSYKSSGSIDYEFIREENGRRNNIESFDFVEGEEVKTEVYVLNEMIDPITKKIRAEVGKWVHPLLYPDVKRRRIMAAPDAETREELKKLAQKEGERIIQSSQEIQITLKGHYYKNRILYRTNTLCKLKDHITKTDDIRLVIGAHYKKEAGGTSTLLRLVPIIK